MKTVAMFLNVVILSILAMFVVELNSYIDMNNGIEFIKLAEHNNDPVIQERVRLIKMRLAKDNERDNRSLGNLYEAFNEIGKYR